MKSAEVKIDGFLCPGHVSIIIGSKAYDFLAKSYNIPCVITGFEPLDVLQGINLLLSQICHNEAKVENEYARVVLPEGNLEAQQLMNRVFKVDNSSWRGLGIIKGSGLRLLHLKKIKIVVVRKYCEVLLNPRSVLFLEALALLQILLAPAWSLQKELARLTTVSKIKRRIITWKK